jgi:hypothetical protein
VIEVTHAGAAARIALRLVLERRLQLGGRLVALRLPEHLQAMAVRVVEAVRRAVTDVAVEPRPVDAGLLQRVYPPSERLGAVCPVREVPEAGLGRGRQLERGPLVVAESAQIDGVAALGRHLHAEELAEVGEALVRLRRQQLDVREVREVANRLRHPNASRGLTTGSRGDLRGGGRPAGSRAP